MYCYESSSSLWKNEVKFGSESMCVEGGQCEQKGVKKERVSGD